MRQTCTTMSSRSCFIVELGTSRWSGRFSVGSRGRCSRAKSLELAEAQEKIIVVPTFDAEQYRPGEEVRVGVRKKAGRIAVMLAYGGALVVLLAALVVTIVVCGASEGAGLLAALGSVAIYYLLLWVFRRRIEHTIQFTITKI